MALRTGTSGSEDLDPGTIIAQLSVVAGSSGATVIIGSEDPISVLPDQSFDFSPKDRYYDVVVQFVGTAAYMLETVRA